MINGIPVPGFLLLFALGLQLGEPVSPRGSIYGVAVDAEGKPAGGIVLCADPLGVPLGALIPATRTNDRGAYRFERLPWWGRYSVYACDEAAGYSLFSTGSSGAHLPAVTIDADHPTAELNVRLARRAGFLRIRLIDGASRLPIATMHVDVRRAATPDRFLFSEGCSADKVILVPPDEDLLVHVSSKGFAEWSESLDKGKLIRLSPGSEATLRVELLPVTPR